MIDILFFKNITLALDEFYRPIPPHLTVKDNWIEGCLNNFFDLKAKSIDNLLTKRKESLSCQTDSPKDEKRPKKSRFSHSENIIAAK